MEAECCIHTLGFGRYHDARFLSTLTRAGTTEGTFQYIASAAEIASNVHTVTQLMHASSFAPTLQLFADDGQLLATIALEADDGSKPAESGKQILTGSGFSKSLCNWPANVKAQVGTHQREVVLKNNL